jgi:hypothetical protein
MSSETAAPRSVGFAWRDIPRQPGRLLPRRFVLRLHQTIGNRAVARLLAPTSTTSALVPISKTETLPAIQAKGWTALWRRLVPFRGSRT